MKDRAKVKGERQVRVTFRLHRWSPGLGPAAALALLGFASPSLADEIGHFSPGVLNIRDFAMPAPGIYGVLYNYGYTSDRLNDSHGDKVRSVTIQPGPGPGLTRSLDVNLDVYVLAPALIWVSPWQILGAQYGAYASPAFANTSIEGSITNATGAGREAEQSQFGMGDLFVQPVWLDWAFSHLDLTLAYGFYAPVGRYGTETVTLPVVGPVTAENTDNIGLGFWTHQFQSAATWYPWSDRRMAILTGLTYERHQEKEDFNLTPGQNLSFNWGIQIS